VTSATLVGRHGSINVCAVTITLVAYDRSPMRNWPGP
jgi:hypothetical protein